METQHSIQFLRKRNALLLLPVPLLLFAVLGFANFHHMPANQALAQNQNSGLNTSLPGAKFDKHQKAGNKMSFYDQAKQDSARMQSNNNNPLLQQFGFKKDKGNIANVTPHNSPLTTAYTDPNVTRINQKLADINKQISQPQTLNTPATNIASTNKPVQDAATAAQISKL